MTKQYKISAQLKNAAKDSLAGKYGTAIGITLLSSLIPMAVSFFISQISVMTELSIYGWEGPQQLITPLSVVFFLITLAASIVAGVLQLGLYLFFLNLACGQPASISNLFYGFRNQSNKALAVSAVLILVNTVCLQPQKELSQLYLGTLDSKWLVLSLAAGAAGLLIYVPLSLSLSQSFFLLLDFPDRPVTDIFKLSIRIMKGHKRRLFYVQFSFIPMYFLCFLSFGIGLLWLTPYMEMTYTQFFLDLMNPQTGDATVT